MVRVKLIPDSIVNVGDGVRVSEMAALRWRSKKPTANWDSMAVWLGLVVGPVTFAMVNRPNNCDLSERL